MQSIFHCLRNTSAFFGSIDQLYVVKLIQLWWPRERRLCCHCRCNFPVFGLYLLLNTYLFLVVAACACSFWYPGKTLDRQNELGMHFPNSIVLIDTQSRRFIIRVKCSSTVNSLIVNLFSYDYRLFHGWHLHEVSLEYFTGNVPVPPVVPDPRIQPLSWPETRKELKSNVLNVQCLRACASEYSLNMHWNKFWVQHFGALREVLNTKIIRCIRSYGLINETNKLSNICKY